MEEGEGVPEFSDERVLRAANFRRALAAPKMNLRSAYLKYDFSPWAGQARPVAPLELSPWLEILARTLALSLLFSAAWVLAYSLAVVNSGLALTDRVLRRIKNGENFLERCQADESTSP